MRRKKKNSVASPSNLIQNFKFKSNLSIRVSTLAVTKLAPYKQLMLLINMCVYYLMGFFEEFE
jgi:hypothetical protein